MPATRAAALASSYPSPRPALRRTSVSRSVSRWLIEAALGDCELLLEAAQLEVIPGQLGRHNHADIFERRVEGLGGGGGNSPI